jgi:hypothetical protein
MAIKSRQLSSPYVHQMIDSNDKRRAMTTKDEIQRFVTFSMTHLSRGSLFINKHNAHHRCRSITLICDINVYLVSGHAQHIRSGLPSVPIGPFDVGTGHGSVADTGRAVTTAAGDVFTIPAVWY